MASSHVVGLDIGSSAVRAVELEFTGRTRSAESVPSLVRVGEVALPVGAVRDGEVLQPAVVSAAVHHLWTDVKFSTKNVVIGVGNQRVVVRDLDLPWQPAEHIRQSLPFQVGDMLPMSVDEALLDYFPTGEAEGPQGRMVRGMLVAAQRDTVTANVLAVEGAGLRPVMVDLNGFALVRALARGEFRQATTALVDIGATITTVVVVQNGIPRLVRALPSGGHNVTTAVSGALSVSVPEAEGLKREIGIGFNVPVDRQPAAEAIGAVVRGLVESIRNTFIYFQGNNPGTAIDVIVLTGGGAHLPGLGQYISSASRLSVVLGDPLAGLRTEKGSGREALAGRESVMALPVGLAYGVAA